MARISDDTKQQILDANDIVEVVTRYVPDLKRAGSTYKACCPFHSEKSPSFNVNPQRQYYKCFGCGEGGDALSFVMKQENLPFLDALKKMAGWANISIQMQEETPQQIAARKGKSRLIELHNDFAKFMHELLLKDPKAQHARDYLKSRGFGSEMASNWLVGYHPETSAQVIEWAKNKGYKARELVEAGLANANENRQRGLYYRFRDRLMFPIANDFGDIIAFSGRQLREDPRSGKYINSPETTIFKKSKVVFGLDKARKQIPKIGFALLCEGQMDVIACHERGFDFAIATQGTACTPEHAVILKRYTKNALICFDSDKAGQKATEKAFVELAKVGLTVKVVVMPEGEDPDSLMQKQGEEAFAKCLEGALDFFDYKVRYEASQRNLDSASEKAELASEMSELLAAMTDNFQLHAALSFLSSRLGISEDDIRNASRRKKRQQRPVRPNSPSTEETDERIEPIKMHQGLSALCHIAMNSPEAYDWMQDQIEPLAAASDGLSGHSVFMSLLCEQPRPENSSSVLSFIEGLSPQLRLTLTPLYNHLNPARPIAAVRQPIDEMQQVFYDLSLDYIERTRKRLALEIGRTDLAVSEIKHIEDQIKFISQSKVEFREIEKT